MDASTEAQIAAWIVGVVLVCGGGLLVWLGRQSLVGKLRRNAFAGVRTLLTMSSDTAWYPAQRAAARPTIVAGWGGVAGGVLTPAVAMLAPSGSEDLSLEVIALAVAVWMLVWVIAGGIAGQRAARSATSDSAQS